MEQTAITRRRILQSAAAGTVGLILEGSKVVSAGAIGSIKIEEPFHGAVLNRRHGTEVSGGLKILVSGQAPYLRDKVAVNGSLAQRSGTRFTSEIILRR